MDFGYPETELRRRAVPSFYVKLGTLTTWIPQLANPNEVTFLELLFAKRLSIEVAADRKQRKSETMSSPNPHENAFNLARRLSARNEPDLLRK